ncbi:phosphatase PAP2 family protein [Nocardioides donggukensis]|uniref:Phosphatase PAP2 family protein n=1 Tax=Nocardioides donggukensis TaxID=2774019 RepID=A0A927Q2A6_9ACTN|nr:phosphatase PAP2 family protein [Nocardioides donggukensis]MBD8871052.1 phosphatase PAP2 family protein [Nocardioides donggukensis]
MSILDRAPAPLSVPSLPRLTAPARPRIPFLVAQLALLTVAVGVYFGVRNLTAGDAALAERNAGWLVGLERSLGLYLERDVQQWALGLDGPVVAVVNAIYIWGHWPVIAATLTWLAVRHREAFRVHRNALLLSGLVGMVIVAGFPVAPPRLMDLGFVDTVTAHSDAYRVLQPPSFTNQYAAMPSFHVGWDLLMGIALAREASRAWVRAIGRALPVLMLVAVVVSGNHYLLDAVVGDAIVLGSLAIATAWAARPGVRPDPPALPRRPRPDSPDAPSRRRG